MPSETTSLCKRERLRRGMTLRALAAACAAAGVPVESSQLSKIERGVSKPRPRLRSVLAELLGLDVVDFEVPTPATSEDAA